MAQTLIGYEVHLGGYGWAQGVVYDGMATGTTGHAIQMECVKVYNLPPGIEYRAHVDGLGWLDWVSSGAEAGTTGQGRNLQALQFRNNGAAADFQVFGRAHCGGIGWQDASSAMLPNYLGTVGQAREMEAIQLWLVVPIPNLAALWSGAGAPLMRVVDASKKVTVLAPLSRDQPQTPAMAVITVVAVGSACCASVNLAGVACAATAGLGCVLGAVGAAAVCVTAAAQGIDFLGGGTPPGGGPGPTPEDDDDDDDDDDA